MHRFLSFFESDTIIEQQRFLSYNILLKGVRPLDTPKWDFSKDIIDVYAPTMFPLEIAKKYEICCFCVNTARGIYYQKKKRGFF